VSEIQAPPAGVEPLPSRKLRALEAALWLAGTLALGWVAWGWLEGRLYERREERLLEAALAAQPSVEEARPSGQRAHRGVRVEVGKDGVESVVSEDVPAGAAARGAATPHTSSRGGARLVLAGSLGRIVVPRVGLAAMIAEGVDHHTLRRSVGHIPGTSPVGGGGNVGLAGHRDTFFRPLRLVRPGDDLWIATAGSIERYRVEWTDVVPPEDTSVLEPTPYPALTLVTCHPFYYVGSAPDRFIVRARLVEVRGATADDLSLLRGGS
jgi:sortase A